MERRAATPEEAKALAHPLRLRILRVCGDRALTNKEIADRLGKDPGTVLHHVRRLVDTGFLALDGVRTGQRGALEKPYRSTGKSWRLSLGFEKETGGVVASLDAFRQEVAEVGPDEYTEMLRFWLRLDPADRDEFLERLRALVEEFVAREDPGGESYGAFFGMHRQS